MSTWVLRMGDSWRFSILKRRREAYGGGGRGWDG